MKLAFVSDSIYPYNKGGKETRSYGLARNLSRRNYVVDFYTMKFWGGRDSIVHSGFNLHKLSKEYPLYVNKRRSIKQGILFGLGAFRLLNRKFDVLDADHMVYFHLWPCKLACMIKRKEFIVTWHEVWGNEYWKHYLGKKGILGSLIESLSSRLPDKIIAVSEQTRKNLIEKLNVPRRKIVVIPNAIDLKEIEKVKPSKETSDIIFAGRLLNHKNVDVLIRVMKQFKNKKLIIIGDGPELENLKTLANDLKLKNMIFKGFIEKSEDVFALIKSSKVFVLPSTREGFGILVIEANACGIPVITTSHKENASRFLIKEGKNGYTCDLEEKCLADKIRIALKRKDWNKEDIKQEVKNYDWDKVIEQFESVYSAKARNKYKLKSKENFAGLNEFSTKEPPRRYAKEYTKEGAKEYKMMIKMRDERDNREDNRMRDRNGEMMKRMNEDREIKDIKVMKRMMKIREGVL